MNYHDNTVRFTDFVSEFALNSVSFRVTDSAVTSGQDPDDELRDGRVMSGGSTGEVNFRCGRKASGGVANFFNIQAPGERNSFGHDAGELNFAVRGELTLRMRGGRFGDREFDVVLDDVMLAQGHSGASNNWWIGGSRAQHVQNDVVAIPVKQAPAGCGITAVKFRRGGDGNGVDEIAIGEMVFPSNADWMRRIDGTTLLSDLMLPGSHDAGMSELHDCVPFAAFTSGLTQTQSMSMKHQLEAGSRYFDVRIDSYNDELVTYHRTGKLGCNGQSLRSILDDLFAFLGERPSEIAIFHFSHTGREGGDGADSIEDRISVMADQYDGMLYKDADPYINLATLTLGKLRGKAIFAFDSKRQVDTTKGRFKYSGVWLDGNNIVQVPSGNLAVFDKYADSDKYGTMKSRQLDLWDVVGPQRNGKFLLLLSWTLTPQPPYLTTIVGLADEAANGLAASLTSYIGGDAKRRPNVVLLDFINDVRSSTVLLHNMMR